MLARNLSGAPPKSEVLDAQGRIDLPCKVLTFLEPARAALEFWSLGWRFLNLAAAPRGDGHSVIVIPGFGTGDASTTALRHFLTALGYSAQSWGLGINTGFARLGSNEKRLEALLERTFAASDQKVSLVGWSLGGIMARLMARRHPNMVRQIIMIGSPFTGDPDAVAIRRLYELVSGEITNSPDARRRIQRDREPVPNVRTCAIYSKSDGITAWQNCVEFQANTEHVEVTGSHLGLVHNADVLIAVANLLHRQADPNF
jgi:pimeloyl-ACP methyl ester carboxylesterase